MPNMLYPTNPTTNTISSKSIRSYFMNSTLLEWTIGYLQSFDVTNVDQWFNKTAENVFSLEWFPFDIYDIYYPSGTQPSDVLEFIKIGKVTTQAQGYKLNKTLPLIYFGGITLPKIYNDFREASPYRKLSIYIPAFGTYPLPTNFGTTLDYSPELLNLYVGVDLVTGMANAYVTFQNPDSTIGDFVILQVSKKISISVPLSLDNSMENQKHLIGTAVSSGVALASAGLSSDPVGVTYGVINLGQNIMSDLNLSYKTYTSSGSIAELYSSEEAYIIEERMISNQFYDSTTLAKIGRPFRKVTSLSSLSGYTECQNAKMSLSGQMTSTECSEIETLLNQGVIL